MAIPQWGCNLMEELHSWLFSSTMPKSFCPRNDVSALIVLDRQTCISLPQPSPCRQQPSMQHASRKSCLLLCSTVVFTPSIRVLPETQLPLYQSTLPSFLCQIQMALGGQEASRAFHKLCGPHQSPMSVTGWRAGRGKI